MKKLLFVLLVFTATACKSQDFIWWVQPESVVPTSCTEGYGLLYNGYVGTDIRKISSSDDWDMPTSTQYNTLYATVGGTSVAGGKLKETGTTYWNSPNTGATNEYFWNARGSGSRSSSGTFSSQNVIYYGWTKSAFGGSSYYAYSISSGSAAASGSGSSFATGNAIRLIYVGAGTPTSYTGNDGKVYRVVLIGTQYWLADNLQETKFRNGDIIPWYGANPVDYFTNAEWAALTTAGVCAYDNDLSNVGCDFSFPSE